ncbi:DsrE family protein [Leuconostoc citreum]|uniref:DsrE family protein n=1 Tax=Leuconostoc citreum TaxID=33964 RepID=UPI003C38CAC4
MNVIVHIDETNKWPTVLSNLSHLYEHWQQSHDDGIIELLVNGEAVTQLRQDADINLTDLYRRGIDVAVCNNSLQQRQILPKQLQAESRIVPSGVVELVNKQHQGFAYIKP